MIYWVAYRKYIPWHRGSHTWTDNTSHTPTHTMHKRLAHKVFSFYQSQVLARSLACLLPCSQRHTHNKHPAHRTPPSAFLSDFPNLPCVFAIVFSHHHFQSFRDRPNKHQTQRNEQTNNPTRNTQSMIRKKGDKRTVPVPVPPLFTPVLSQNVFLPSPPRHAADTYTSPDTRLQNSTWINRYIPPRKILAAKWTGQEKKI
jgi:hypothetical protein